MTPLVDFTARLQFFTVSISAWTYANEPEMRRTAIQGVIINAVGIVALSDKSRLPPARPVFSNIPSSCLYRPPDQ